MYLVVLVAAPAAALIQGTIPWAPDSEQPVGNVVAGALLLLALALRLWLRRRAPDTGWVRARQDVEDQRAAAWVRIITGRPAAFDTVAAKRLAAAAWRQRWEVYRRLRVDDQIAYFELRARHHRTIARRWERAQTLLALLALPVAVVQVAGYSDDIVGLVVAALASSEAWLQFRRSNYLTTGYTTTAVRLLALGEDPVRDEVSLHTRVAETEALLAAERRVWVALTSVEVFAGRSVG